VRELEQFLNTEAEWVLERLATSLSEANDRNYYQGRLDQLAQVRRYLVQPQIMRQIRRRLCKLWLNLDKLIPQTQ
jgi:hypothetical protein